MIGVGLVNPAFWNLDNQFSLLRSNVVIGIMALGVLLVMISGGIDVSFPAFAVAAMYLTVKGMVEFGYTGVALPFVVATAIGLLLGAVNAFCVRSFRMIPLIVTLGTASVVRGLLLGVVGTSTINIGKMPPQFIAFGNTEIVGMTHADESRYGLTAMVLIYAAVALAVHLVLRYTMIGRSLYAFGGAAEAAARVGFERARRCSLPIARRRARRFRRAPAQLHDLARQSARFRRLRARRDRRCGARRGQHLRRQGERVWHAPRRLHAGDDQEQPHHHAHRRDLAASRRRPGDHCRDGPDRMARSQEDRMSATAAKSGNMDFRRLLNRDDNIVQLLLITIAVFVLMAALSPDKFLRYYNFELISFVFPESDCCR